MSENKPEEVKPQEAHLDEVQSEEVKNNKNLSKSDVSLVDKLKDENSDSDEIGPSLAENEENDDIVADKSEQDSKEPSDEPIKKKPKTWLKVIISIIFIMGIAAGYVVWDLMRFAQSPLDSTAEEVIFDVEKGVSFNHVAEKLKAEGLISSVERFKILGHIAEATGKLQAGHFAVSASMSPQDILDVLLYGKSVLYRVTIQEGLPWWKIGKLLEEEGFTTYRDFQAVVHDPDFLRRYGIPFDSAEGFLFPDTYLLRKPRQLDRKAAEAVASRLVDTFWESNKGVLPEGMQTPVDKLKYLVILASIVEKETNKAEERARVAGVYANRLRIPMRLQADPTVIYGLGPSFNGNITRANLKDDSNPYNTYRHDGLPPGPICSMGKKALEAAAHPEKHKYLYFVAKGGGLHHFSTNYEEHKRAVNKYIRKK